MTKPSTDIAERIDAYHESQREPEREHLGCSVAGKECKRAVWYDFRWATTPKHPGRVLRIFRRGREEEERVCSDLAAIGLPVSRRQERVDFGHLVQGSIDGVISLDGVSTLLEIKTHPKKSFADLVKRRVFDAKREHFAQMQLYMLGLGLTQALYFAVCKDDDEIHAELVPFDPQYAAWAKEHALEVAKANESPPRLSNDPTFYLCKLCNHAETCFKQTDAVNCRTCCHSTNTADGWACEKSGGHLIPLVFQRHGCESHVFHPHVVPSWERLESIGEWSAPYRLPDGREVINGNPGETLGAVTSAELIGGMNESATQNETR